MPDNFPEILDPHHSREHGRMIERAIRKGWIKPKRWNTDKPKTELIEELRERQTVTLKERAELATFELMEGDLRAKGIGAKIVTTMEKQNQADEHHVEGEHKVIEHTGSVGITALRQEVVNDPEYLDYLRHRAIEANGDTGALCSGSQRGAVETSETPVVSRQDNNGHHQNGRTIVG